MNMFTKLILFSILNSLFLEFQKNGLWTLNMKFD